MSELTVEIDDELYERAADYAETQGMTPEAFIALAIEEYLDQVTTNQDQGMGD